MANNKFRYDYRITKSDKRYELAEETKKEIDGRVFYRIRALIDMPEIDVKAGDLGGWLETENSLYLYRYHWVGLFHWQTWSESVKPDTSWVFREAMVYADARVSQKAVICGNTKIKGSEIHGDAHIAGNAIVENSEVCGHARVSGNARVLDGSLVMGYAKVYDNAVVSHSRVFDRSTVHDFGAIRDTTIDGDIRVFDHALLEKCDIKGYGKFFWWHHRIGACFEKYGFECAGGSPRSRMPWDPEPRAIEMTGADRRIFEEVRKEYYHNHIHSIYYDEKNDYVYQLGLTPSGHLFMDRW